MVVINQHIRELARPVIKIIQDEAKTTWQEKIRKTALVQNIISDTEVAEEELVARMRQLIFIPPRIIDKKYGLKNSEWTNFLRKFFANVKKCDQAISTADHIGKCEKLAEAFLQFEDVKSRWEYDDTKAFFHLAGQKIEGKAKSVIGKYYELIISTLYYVVRYNDIKGISITKWPEEIRVEETTVTELEANGDLDATGFIEIMKKGRVSK